MGISNIIFILILAAAIGLFSFQLKKIIRNIRLGKSKDLTDNKKERLKTMIMVALGQSKMTKKPVAGILHIIVYVGFVIINIEVLEIIIDGVFGTHRVFSFLGGFYNFLIGSFEILAFLVLVACVIFFIRRNVLYIKRFRMKELDGWPKSDANLILIAEVLLMSAFLSMDAADAILQQRGEVHYLTAGSFPISEWLIMPLFENLSNTALIAIERGTWWFHIIGILAFLNYLPISKHFHIMLAFPNTYFSNLKPKGEMDNMESVKKEVELMMDPNADPFAAPTEPVAEPETFGAKDVTDLSWKNLMDAYSCTECGRCTSNCPANLTGKLLSPRKIMMDTRDRLEEVGKNIDKNGAFVDDQKSLLNNYISKEELWACTTCNACVEACPINIDPLNIIVNLRRNLVMESSEAPSELNTVFSNIENNGAPWQMSPLDRLNWKDEA